MDHEFCEKGNPIPQLCTIIGENVAFLRRFSWSKFCKSFSGKSS
jgi:hypothetical protein